MLILLLPSTPQWVHSLGKLTALYRIVIWLNCQLMHNDFRFYPIALKLWKKKKKDYGCNIPWWVSSPKIVFDFFNQKFRVQAWENTQTFVIT